MNIVFFGSSNFAVPSLKVLLTSGHRISCVVTQPDKKKGRGLSLGNTAIKMVAEESNLKIYQPERINTSQALTLLEDLRPDLFVVIAYGQILSQEILDIPKIFSINVHASLLPRYRGAAPINWAIICGEKITGITIIRMTEKMDAGPIIAQERIDIQEDDTAITLEDKLSKAAAGLLIKTVISIKNNSYKSTPQDESKLSFAPKLKKEDGLINWNKSACEICNLVRGCMPWPGAFTYYKGKLLKIYKAKVIPLSGCSVSPLAGKIAGVSKEGIVINTEKDNLMIQELQIEGKRRMTVEEFIAGHKISVGENWAKNDCIKNYV
jgi:methionyl-tRNA formyltransferase